MTAAVMRDPSSVGSYQGLKNMGYGPNAIRATDELLLEEVRSGVHIATMSHQKNVRADQSAHANSLEAINAELAEARKRREKLEMELARAKETERRIGERRKRVVEKVKEKTEMERKRKEAFAMVGAKPMGVTKTKTVGEQARVVRQRKAWGDVV